MRRRRVVSVFLALTALLVTGTGIAWAAGITLTTKQLGAAPVTTPVMFPVSVTLANKTGQTAGKIENGDTITIVWSQLVSAPTLCSGWSNTGTPASMNYLWVINNSTPNDTLTTSGTSATCTTGMHVGTIDLGAPGYNNSATSAIRFPNSLTALSYSGNQTTLTVTLGGRTGGTQGTVGSGAAATWTCDAALTDRSARTCGANISTSTNTVQF